MKAFKMDSITRKLAISFSFLLLTLLVFSLFALYGIHAISTLTHTIYAHPLVVSNAALRANVGIIKMHRNMKDVVLFGDPEKIESLLDSVDIEAQRVYRQLDIVKKYILGSRGKTLENETRILFAKWQPIREEVIGLVRDGQKEAATEITIGKVADHVTNLETKMTELSNYARTKASSIISEAEKTQSNLQVMLVVFLLSAVTISLLIAFITLKTTTAAEKELRESRQLLLNAIDYAPIGMAFVSLEGRYQSVNKAFLEMTGYPEQSLFEMTLQDITHPSDIDSGVKVVQQMIEGKRKRAFLEKKYIKKDGTAFDVHVSTSLISDAKGAPPYFFTQIQDITERKRNELRIDHLNRVLRTIRNVNQLIVRERNPDTLIRDCCRLLVENRGYTAAHIVLTDEQDRPLTWARSGAAPSSETINAVLERSELPHCCEIARSAKAALLVDGQSGACTECPIAEQCAEAPLLCVRLHHEDAVFGYVLAARDLVIPFDDEERGLFSEMAADLAYALNYIRMEAAQESSDRHRKSLERQLLQAQKIESVGLLAGGVAHDYNNMLSIIMGYAGLALEKVVPEDPIHADLLEILSAARRSADITKQLLAFARQQTVAPVVLDLNQTIESMLNMLRRLIGENIDLVWRPGEGLWPVRIDPSQIDQILANLLVNARDAIADVGKVTIETENIRFDADYCADHPGFVPGDYALLSVSDDGSGIAPKTLDRIFDPFFTTKGIGQGTGLGLSTVYGIVKQNSGFINVYSEPEIGTTIKVYLARHTGQAVVAHRESMADIPSSRGETVLLVEDDESILKLGIRMLEGLGYAVLSSTTPTEAEDLAESHDGVINLLITDVVMPEMNGRELSERLQSRFPGLKTLYMSGYTANVIAHHGILDDDVCFMAKPFSKMEMAVKVREAIDS